MEDFDRVKLVQVDEVYCRIVCEVGILMELKEAFSFMVPGAKFHPLVKAKRWDGKIYMVNQMKRTIYVGLADRVREFCESRNYQYEYVPLLQTPKIPPAALEKFVAGLGLPFAPRDYQMAAVKHAVDTSRAVLLSPTGSGKSLIIYIIQQLYSLKTLVIVPTVSLVHQMASDFESYGYKGSTHKIISGTEKDTDARIVISTWQSIFKMPKSWFSQFKVVFGDEAHLFKAKSLSSILEKMTECRFRFGLTGTIDDRDSKVNKLVLEGLFGPVYRTAHTVDLIEEKHLAELQINVINLQYPMGIRKWLRAKKSYQEEIDFIVGCKERNTFIRRLALSLKGNTLILFQFVDKHGAELFREIKEISPGRSVFFIHGGVLGDEREDIRNMVENLDNAIIVASFGTFSTGVNIKNLHNVIFASPTKAKVKTLQSIGRVLRTTSKKSKATLFDLCDDLRLKNHSNYTYRHFEERLRIYIEEGFNHEIADIPLDVRYE